ncbi:hypothetical protein [Haloplanus halophilus]|uniref:hypothetical protein n=1 Tax=Haloplanus halophilus TaxID=2949993 RepID=UPI0020409B0C|nr:hypothetical protein [Haloplanus sp. GDY1]
MSLTVEMSDRFLDAADEWAEARMEDREAAVETKVEQALLEIEYLVTGATEIAFDVDVEREVIRYTPSADLADLLSEQAAETGLDESTILGLHVDLFVGAFSGDDDRPPNAPPV